MVKVLWSYGQEKKIFKPYKTHKIHIETVTFLNLFYFYWYVYTNRTILDPVGSHVEVSLSNKQLK